MVFGDIVEPSTRALLYEEDDCIVEEDLNWEIQCPVPTTIEAFLVSETLFTNKIMESVFLHNKKPVAQTKGRVISIYNFENTKFIALFNATPNTSVGNATAVLLPWIQAAEKCYSLITLPTASYQNKNMSEQSLCVLRMLSSSAEQASICPRLETPNLITGIGANCLSYCTFADKTCSLFIGYIDYAPIDSINSQPFIDLLKAVGFDSHGKIFKLTDKLPQNNLYI